MSEVMDKIREKYGEKIKIFEKSKKRVYISIAKSDAKEFVGWLYKDLGARMQIATAVDERTGIELIYHMAFDKENLVVSVRFITPKPEIEMPTFTDVVPATLWIEREIHEMFGVEFKGHPDLSHLLLPDDWEEGRYPFRKKSFDSESEGVES